MLVQDLTSAARGRFRRRNRHEPVIGLAAVGAALNSKATTGGKSAFPKACAAISRLEREPCL